MASELGFSGPSGHLNAWYISQLHFSSILDLNTHGATVVKLRTYLYVEPRLLCNGPR